MSIFRKAERKKARARIAITGPAGSGKTYSALLIAKGLVGGDLAKVAVIDTENGSGDLYSDLGGYAIATMNAPFGPDRFIKALAAAADEGFECVIIDSLSHAWTGKGGILEMHDRVAGKNSYNNWAKVTPKHEALVNAILESPVHVVATMRAKTKYVLEEQNGKQVPVKVGMGAVQRQGVEYEFTIVFDLSDAHLATTSKDRTGLFEELMEVPTPAIGESLRAWLDAGADRTGPAEVMADDTVDDAVDSATAGALNSLAEIKDDLAGKDASE